MSRYAFSDYESSDDEFEFTTDYLTEVKEDLSKEVILNESESN